MRAVRRCDRCGIGFEMHDRMAQPADHVFAPGSALIELTAEEARDLIHQGYDQQFKGNDLLYPLFIDLARQA